jgi:hypothetical protein
MAVTQAIRIAAPAPPGMAANREKLRLMKNDATPALAEATTYRQTVAITLPTPRSIGLPAYHIAGMVRIQNDTHHAMAMP